ncbi:hypothetical protein ACTJKU_12705, partial [Citrobacter freundii]
VSHNYCHCFSLMSPICGAHQPRRFGSRLMGFLLPVIIPYTNQIVKTLQSNLWRQSGDTFSLPTSITNLDNYLFKDSS